MRGIDSVLGDVIGWLLRGVIVIELFLLLFYAAHTAFGYFTSSDPVTSAQSVTAFWVPILKMGVGFGAILGLLGYAKGRNIKPERHEFFGWLQYGVIASEMFILLAVGSLHFETGLKFYEWLWLFALTYIFGFVLGLYGYKRTTAERMERLYGKVVKSVAQPKPPIEQQEKE